MLSIIIPTLNEAARLPATLEALRVGQEAGLISQIILSDGGSRDDTITIGRQAGARVVNSEKGRGQQLRTGAERATAPHLLFLHADTMLRGNWVEACEKFIAEAPTNCAGYFRFRFDDDHPMAHLIAWGVAWRCRFAQLPYGDQGLLITRQFYDQLGGFAPLPIMEDVDMITRIKQAGRLGLIKAEAMTDASRYRRDGYWQRVWRNRRCMAAWRAGKSPEEIAQFYEK